MKKIKFFPSALEIRPASTIFGTEFLAVKLSFEQAMAFTSGFISFDQMIEIYGTASILQLGEQYDGYAAVFYNSWKQSVIKLRGAVEHFTEVEAINMMPSSLRDAALNNAAYKIVYRCADGKRVQGAALYVWTFGDCRFSELIHTLQKQGKMSSSLRPDAIEISLKRKIFQSLTTDEAISVTEDEDDVLLRYLGKNYYTQFIAEVPDEE